MTKRESEVIDFQLVKVSQHYYTELVEEIVVRMKRIRDAKNSEGGVDEEGQFPMVRVAGGV
jgi:hypothetical protein